MKKLILLSGLMILLSGCFGADDVNQEATTNTPEQTQEQVVEVTEKNTEPELSEEVGEDDTAAEDVENTPEIDVTEDPQDSSGEAVRGDIENNSEATVVEQDTTVIPTEPAPDTTQKAEEAEEVDEEIEEELLDVIDSIFDGIESDA